MSFQKVSFEESLEKNVVSLGKCLGCGACVVTCPFNCLEYKEGKPDVVNECKLCGICAKVCPTNEWSWAETENHVFGRQRMVEEEFGVFRRIVLAQASDEEILRSCQDGGVVTALLTFALENGFIESAVVSGLNEEKPLYPVPKLVATSREILECAGTRYSYSPNILALSEVVKQKHASIAFVGTPCQIRSLRKIQKLGLKKYANPLRFLIGLFCSECFTYEGLLGEYIQGKLGVNLDDVEKINIKGKILVKTRTGMEEIPLGQARQYARESCRFCDDFSSELADISTGGLGVEGWTFTIIRTETGEDLFSNAEKAGFLNVKAVDEAKKAFDLLIRLSKKKRKPRKTA